jgi:hypothetical protein
VDKVSSTLKHYGLPLQCLLADGGFGSGENYAFLEAKKVKGFISLPGSYHPVREGFSYDTTENAYVCGNGKLLYYHGIKIEKGFANHYYHARVKDCSVCPLKKIVVAIKGDKASLSVSTATIINACRNE